MGTVRTSFISEILPDYRLPLPLEAWQDVQNLVLRERERCVGCGDDGVYWYGHGWLCAECDR